jgi:hypothetical protein
MKNIHVLPTDKPSKLCYDKHNNLVFDSNARFVKPDNKQHLYITSDEEIKGSCWVFDGRIVFNRSDMSHVSWEYANKYWKKIILTTDQDLIKDGVQAIDDEFLEWFVKNPSCENAYVEGLKTIYQKDWVYKIIIPKEEPKLTFEEYEQQGLEKYSYELKQETLEEAAKNYAHNYFDMHETNNYKALKNGFEQGAKWQAERMYSEEEVRELLRTQRGNSYVAILTKTKDQELAAIASTAPEPAGKDGWVKQFKKEQ